ncbi:MAG: hypothetical protein H6741_16365 [Alphaproteobacteria bacterium]|nr:hypothetical protein [Alphaproteobacteria bacterium]
MPAQELFCALSGDVHVRTAQGVSWVLRAAQLMPAEAFSDPLVGGYVGVLRDYHGAQAYASAPERDDALVQVSSREWDGAGPARFTSDFAYMLGTKDRHGVFAFHDPTGVNPWSSRVDGPLKGYRELVWVDPRRALLVSRSQLELISLEGEQPVVEGAWEIAEQPLALASDGQGRVWIAALDEDRLALYLLDRGEAGPRLEPSRALSLPGLDPEARWVGFKVVDGLPLLLSEGGQLLALSARRDHLFSLDLAEGERAEGLCVRRQARTLEVVSLVRGEAGQRVQVQRVELGRAARVRLPALEPGVSWTIDP